MQASKVTTKGQITIPQEYREILGVRAGDKVVFESDAKGGLSIKKLDTRVSLAGYLEKKIKGKASDAKIDKAIAQGWEKHGRD